MQELARGGLQLVASDGCAGCGQGDEGSRPAARASGDSRGGGGQQRQGPPDDHGPEMDDHEHDDRLSRRRTTRRSKASKSPAAWCRTPVAANHNLFMGAAIATAKLGVKYLSMHAGFIDESNKAYAEKIYARIRDLANIAADNGVILLLETGQETAKDLRHFLEKLDHQSVGVNFDPANMILYDKGDPIEAVRRAVALDSAPARQGCHPDEQAGHLGQRSPLGRRPGRRQTGSWTSWRRSSSRARWRSSAKPATTASATSSWPSIG